MDTATHSVIQKAHTAPALKFGFYQEYGDTRAAGKARLFLPGNAGKNVEMAVFDEQKNAFRPLETFYSQEDDRWYAKEPVKKDAWYQIKVDGKIQPLPVQQKQVNVDGQDQAVHHVAVQEAKSSGVMLDSYIGTLLTPAQRKWLEDFHGGRIPPQSPHKFPTMGNEAVLKLMMPHFKRAGATSYLFKPFIGGDNLSDHRYWTIDPYVLNSTFSSRQAYQNFTQLALLNDIKLFADGAFVNQGFNGIQKLSNVVHGHASPFWNWFTENDQPEGLGPLRFPEQASGKDRWGILPVAQDSDGASWHVMYDRVALRVLNDPASPDYNPKDYTFVETYNPDTQTPDGKPVKPPYEIKYSWESLQNLKIPVNLKELESRRAFMNKPLSQLNDADRNAMLEWRGINGENSGGVRLTPRWKDNSGFKWDGNIDVAKMNMRNQEVVDYMKGAVAYWTHDAQITVADTLTRALVRARQQNPKADAATLLQSITHSREEVPYRETDPNKFNAACAQLMESKPLPPCRYPDLERLTWQEAEDARKNVQTSLPEDVGAHLAHRLLTETSLNALELPELFKASLSYPVLDRKLRNDSQGFIRRFATGILTPFARNAATAWMVKPFLPFETLLSVKMDTVMDDLQKTLPRLAGKLRDERIQSLVTGALAEKIYMNVFTGLDDAEIESRVEAEADKRRGELAQLPEPMQLEEKRLIRERVIRNAFLDVIPQAIYRTDPESAARLLPAFMKKRLDAVPNFSLGNLLKRRTNDLEPEMAALAEAAMHKRELGLNWRLDAAKDVSNIDYSRNFNLPDRAEAFTKEVHFMMDFWRKMSSAIHKENPKSSIIMEFTDYYPLTGNDEPTIKKLLGEIFKDNTFDGMVNWDLYKPFHQFVHHNQRPDEPGGTGHGPMGPNRILDHLLKQSDGMLTTFPQPIVLGMQNLASCHDQPTSTQGLFLNPDLAFMDHYAYWGLKDDFREITNEFQHKPCFEETRQALGIQNLNSVMQRLRKYTNGNEKKELSAEFINHCSPMVREHYDTPSKEKAGGGVVPTPFEMKPKFVNELFATLKPTDLGITPAQHEALRKALVARITEPSEARGMRATWVNTMANFNWNEMPQAMRLPANESEQLKKAFWHAIDQAFYENGDNTPREVVQRYGYMPPDMVLDRVMDQLAKDPKLPAHARNKAFMDEFKMRLYAQAMRPVLAKLLRVFAAQTAMPGNASIYLQDLFARGGGELAKNLFVQDRNVIDLDKLLNPKTGDAEFVKFFHDAADLFTARSIRMVPTDSMLKNGDPLVKNTGLTPEQAHALRISCAQALNNGYVINATLNHSGADEADVLPIVRDNGKDQAIVLINGGKPKDQNGHDYNKDNAYGYNNRIGQDALYNEIRMTQPLAANVKLDFSSLNLKPGTRYIDVNNGEAFVLSADGHLVSAKNPDKGIDVEVARFLVRDNTQHPVQNPDILPESKYHKPQARVMNA